MSCHGQNKYSAQYSVKPNRIRISAPVSWNCSWLCVLTKEEKSLTCRVCPSVRDLLHSTKPFAEQYSSYLTDLSVQRELGNFRLAEGWVRASACTVRICVPICLKFGVVPNIHAVWLWHFEFRENRRSESRFSLTCISGHRHNSVLSAIRFAPTALWVCENLRIQGRTFVVAVNKVTCVLWNRVTSWERLCTLTECVVGSALHCAAPVHATYTRSNLNCVCSLSCARPRHWPTYYPLYKHLLLNV